MGPPNNFHSYPSASLLLVLPAIIRYLVKEKLHARNHYPSRVLLATTTTTTTTRLVVLLVATTLVVVVNTLY